MGFPGANTKPCRLYGRSRRGQRLVGCQPQGHYQTSTLIAAVRLSGPCAPWLFEGAMDGEMFLAWVRQGLVPQLQSEDWVILDNLVRRLEGRRSPLSKDFFSCVKKRGHQRLQRQSLRNPALWKRTGPRNPPLTRLMASLSHRMGKGQGEGSWRGLGVRGRFQICNLQFSIPNFQFLPLSMNRLLSSLSHRMGEGWGEGPLRFMVTIRVNNLRFFLSMNRWFFSLSLIGGEGRGEGALWFMAPTRLKNLTLLLSRNILPSAAVCAKYAPLLP